jgi:large subunit ribosomal protein L25
MHTLEVKQRPAGKASALRRDGFVPGVVYGPSIESTSIAISRKDLQSLFSEITRSSRINLAIAGENETKEVDVFLKVVDYDPITDEPKHVDFYHPDVGHPLKLHVPVRITGEAQGVASGGILNVLFNTIRVQGLSKDVPPLITVDVSELELGESIHVRDIDFGGVEPMLPPERTLVTVIAPRGMEMSEEEAALEEAALEEAAMEGEGEEGAVEGEGAPAEKEEETAAEGE